MQDFQLTLLSADGHHSLMQSEVCTAVAPADGSAVPARMASPCECLLAQPTQTSRALLFPPARGKTHPGLMPSLEAEDALGEPRRLNGRG